MTVYRYLYLSIASSDKDAAYFWF